jgi:1-acyl-sn-glycerol-3-phosphate acyltransferase
LATILFSFLMRILHKTLIILYQPYKWLFYFPFLLINTLIFGIIAVLFSMLFNQRIGSYFGGAIWSRLNSILVPMLVSVKGRENINPCTSYIVLTNHQSAYDIFLVYGWLGIDIKWIMKKELRKVPGLGFGSEKVGHIFLDRSNSRAALKSLEEAKKKLVNGTSVVIFPEGTRSKTGTPGAFTRGAFKLALDLGLPVLPVTLVNTRNILPSDSFNVLPGKVGMVIHPPVDISGYNEQNMNELIDRVREQICSALPEKLNS